MNSQMQQRGLVVLVLLVLTSLAASALLSVHSVRLTTATHKKVLNQKADLLHARNALVSYTVHYPYLYGARGSGTGHFPCPDKDGRTESTGSVWSLRLGPNPPCGSLSTAEGWLPAHISFSNHRYSFTTHLSAPIHYRVSGGFINNPVNRTVNPAVMLKAQQQSVSVVELKQSARNNNESYRNNAKAVVTPALMLLSTKPSVAAWLVKRMGELDSLTCLLFAEQSVEHQEESTDAPVDLPAGHKTTQQEWCSQFHEVSKRCVKSAPFTTVALIINRPNHISDLRISEKTHSQLITLLLADEFSQNYDCNMSPNLQLLIDGVSAKFHWYVRNDWAHWTTLVIDKNCFVYPGAGCGFRKFSGYSKNASPLLVHWGLQ